MLMLIFSIKFLSNDVYTQPTNVPFDNSDVVLRVNVENCSTMSDGFKWTDKGPTLTQNIEKSKPA